MKSEFYSHYSKVKDWLWANFVPREIACKGTGEIRVDYDAMDKLQKLRDIVKCTVLINSAYRSETHNRNVGGAKNSYHRKGQAFDIRITPNLTRETIHNAAKEAGFNGIIDYNSFVHVDTRPVPYYGDSRK